MILKFQRIFTVGINQGTINYTDTFSIAYAVDIAIPYGPN